MSGGTIFLIFALLSLSGLGICHKVADFHRCKPSAIGVVMFSAAALVLWSYTFYLVMNRGLTLFPPFTMNATVVALVCGACAGIAILTFQIGIRYGRIATSWLVINLSTIITALLSLIVYREWEQGIKREQIIGLALVIISVILLWRDKVEEQKERQHGFPVIETNEKVTAPLSKGQEV